MDNFPAAKLNVALLLLLQLLIAALCSDAALRRQMGNLCNSSQSPLEPRRLRGIGSEQAAKRVTKVPRLPVELYSLLTLRGYIERALSGEKPFAGLHDRRFPRQALEIGISDFIRHDTGIRFSSENAPTEDAFKQLFNENILEPCLELDRRLANWWQQFVGQTSLDRENFGWLVTENICRNILAEQDDGDDSTCLLGQSYKLLTRRLDRNLELSSLASELLRALKRVLSQEQLETLEKLGHSIRALSKSARVDEFSALPPPRWIVRNSVADLMQAQLVAQLLRDVPFHRRLAVFADKYSATFLAPCHSLVEQLKLWPNLERSRSGLPREQGVWIVAERACKAILDDQDELADRVYEKLCGQREEAAPASSSRRA